MAKIALVWLLMQPPDAGAPPIRWPRLQKMAARLPGYAADLRIAAVQRGRVRAILEGWCRRHSISATQPQAAGRART